SERVEITQARLSGWAYSEGEVIDGMASIAAPVVASDGSTRAALAVVHLAADIDSLEVAPQVAEAAQCLGAGLT
ncbi:MAG: hypothetical protein MKZ77_02850, partial [Acidimicrobiales bacterium]|nr:hypothetical protein [Acidimicrobiales bacterium]